MNLELSNIVCRVINDLDPEFRIPVITAFNVSDGTIIGFRQELESALWDIPDLPVEEIMNLVQS